MNTRKNNSLTIEEHLEISRELSIVAHYLSSIFNKLQRHYNKSSRLMKLLRKITPLFLGGLFIQIQSELDTEWHRAINNNEFNKYGHIYYNLESRYEKLRKEIKTT
ncbi:MAG: hypothetical protein QG610_637 [Euryarchaeota archaeon]|nr:hypothetical protein [Euryarchaeota archaeon]